MRARATFRSPAAGLRQPRNQAHRVIACAVIILGHCEAATGIDDSYWGHLFQLGLNIWAQYAVPFFFVLAGYSLAPKLTRPGAIRFAARYTYRILIVFLATSSLYFALGALAQGRPGEAVSTVLIRQAARQFGDPLMFVLGGAGHLWFLVGLIVAVWTTVWLRGRGRLRHLLVLGLIFYAAMLVTGPYAVVVGWPHLPEWRRTLFAGTPFLIVGLFLRHLQTLPRERIAYALVVAGVACVAAEQYWLWSVWGTSPFVTGTLAGTAIQSIGISLLAVRPGSSNFSRVVGRFGPLTLVVYLIHVAFVDVLRPYRVSVDRSVWRWLFPLEVAVLSFTVASVAHIAFASYRHRRRRRLAAEVDGGGEQDPVSG